MDNENNRQIMKEILVAQENGEPIVLATIIRARGSVPRHSGSKMIIYADGRTSGTIGGGELESRIIDEAMACFADGQTRIVPFSLVDPQRGDPGLCGGEVEVYLEPYAPPVTLLVIGCGHVGKALASLARWMGYRVIVSDDREELASPDNIPDADVYCPGEISAVLAQLNIHSNTHIAVLTRNVSLDRQILPLLADSAAPYIGIIGSRRRWQETIRLLQADGFDEQKLNKFHSPIGLELMAESPEEIAISIMAEIVMMRRGGTGERMAETRTSAAT